MIDESGHEVPGDAADEPWLGRIHFTNLARSINDIVPVANATAMAQLVTDRNAKLYGPTATRPLYVDRLDLAGATEGAQSRILRTTDGTTWQALTGEDGYTAESTGVTFPATGGTLGITSTITIPAEPWSRMVHLEFQAMASAIPSGYVEVQLRQGTTPRRGGRTPAPNTTVSGHYWDFLGPNASTAFQLVAVATSAAVVTGNALYTALTATVRGA